MWSHKIMPAYKRPLNSSEKKQTEVKSKREKQNIQSAVRNIVSDLENVNTSPSMSNNLTDISKH